MINIFKKFLSIFKRTTNTTEDNQHYAIDIRMDPTSAYSFTLDSNISKKITREYIIDALPEDMQLHIIPKVWGTTDGVVAKLYYDDTDNNVIHMPNAVLSNETSSIPLKNKQNCLLNKIKFSYKGNCITIHITYNTNIRMKTISKLEFFRKADSEKIDIPYTVEKKDSVYAVQGKDFKNNTLIILPYPKSGIYNIKKYKNNELISEFTDVSAKSSKFTVRYNSEIDKIVIYRTGKENTDAVVVYIDY